MYNISNDANSTISDLDQYINNFSDSLSSDKFNQKMRCRWDELRKQLLQQWGRLTLEEIDKAGPRRDKLARLIQTKYGINVHLAENYLRNFERVLPLM